MDNFDQRINSIEYCQVFPYKIRAKSLPNIINHVYIPKKATENLSKYIKNENWGENNVLLHKYLDYIWRVQLLDHQVKQFYHNKTQKLVFHSGLYRERDNEEIYICLIPNNACWTQRWQLSEEYISINRFTNEIINKSFVTKSELINIYKFSKYNIPVMTNFDKMKQKIQFNPEYSVIMNIPEMVRTTQKRIMKCLRNEGIKRYVSRYVLQTCIENSIKKGLHTARNNPNIICQQLFMEHNVIDNNRYTTGYHLELLLPITLNLNHVNMYMAIVLRPNDILRQYEGMSIITREMGYINSRLLGTVNKPWLKYFITSNKINYNTEQLMIYECNQLYNNNTSRYNNNSDIICNYVDVPSPVKLFDINQYNIKGQNSPFFFISTILPLKLPKLKSII